MSADFQVFSNDRFFGSDIMIRFATFTVVLASVVCLGCGQSSDNAQTAQTTPSTPQATLTAVATASPTDVVSQFLDEVRRGGANSAAGNLLTQRAQAVLKKIGRTVQPLGTPDAKFEVTRGQQVPGDENAVLVHSIWTEPHADGTKSQFQVVWAVQKEAAGWRISGLAMEEKPGAEPQIIDFENGAMMAQLLTEPEPPAAQTASATQAAPATQTTPVNGNDANQAAKPADATIR